MDRNQDIPMHKITGVAAILMFIAPVFGVLSWGVGTFTGIVLTLISGVMGNRDDSDRSAEVS